MRRLALGISVPALGVCVALGIALFGASSSGAAPAAHLKTGTPAGGKVTTITVTPGKPSELAFKLSKTSMIPAGTVTFKVTNMGVAYHNFKLCMKPVASATNVTNACTGKATAILKNGQSATLTVTVSKTGLYEFLCSVPGHAAAGMKGVLGIGVAVTKTQELSAAHAGTTTTTTTTTPSTSTPTTSTPTTTRPSSGGSSGGDQSGCPPGTTIKSSGNTDADGDELGTEPDDNDGCV